ncbi:uncharacterized protein BcabD6B2_21680 [Babesia caballi]|uniref:Uncharacterized protein n=1 Tax=Babesia caballi TaxID=5871 RepID=A0AAV4LSG7_BABCB|nr:hypothetical protein BcabD6B2_21680 [Babesia caballi]
MKYLLGHFGLGALEPHDDRHLHLGRLGSLHERGGKLVALDDSPDNVHQQDLGVGVRGDNVERLIEHGARGVAADVEEVGGRSTVVRQQIQSGHGQPRPVDDARHIAAQRNVVQARLERPCLQLVFRRGHRSEDLLLPKVRVVVDDELGVAGHQPSVGRLSNRVDFQQEGVLLDEGVVQRFDEPLGFSHQARREVEMSGNLCRHVLGDSPQGVDWHGEHGGRVLFGHLLHIAAPVLGGYGHDAAGGPVQHEGDVPLLGQSQLLRHHDLLALQPRRASLLGHQGVANHPLRRGLREVRGPDQLDSREPAASELAFTPPSSEDLSLHHDLPALRGLEDLTRHGLRLRGGARQQVHRRRDSMLPQHLHATEFRNVQKAPRVARMCTTACYIHFRGGKVFGAMSKEVPVTVSRVLLQLDLALVLGRTRLRRRLLSQHLLRLVVGDTPLDIRSTGRLEKALPGLHRNPRDRLADHRLRRRRLADRLQLGRVLVHCHEVTDCVRRVGVPLLVRSVLGLPSFTSTLARGRRVYRVAGGGGRSNRLRLRRPAGPPLRAVVPGHTHAGLLLDELVNEPAVVGHVVLDVVAHRYLHRPRKRGQRVVRLVERTNVGVVQRVERRDALVRVELQQLLDQIDGVVGRVRQLRQDAPDRPHVDALGVLGAADQDLGGTVPPGRDVVREDRRLVGDLIVRDAPREPEIRQLDVAFRIQQNVGRLQVPVQQVAGVDVVDGLNNLVENVLFVHLLQNIYPDNGVQIRVDILEGEVEIAVIFRGVYLLQLHDVVGLAQVMQEHNLPVGPLRIRGVPKSVEYFLQRYHLLGLLVDHLPDDAVGALAQLLEDVELAQDVLVNVVTHPSDDVDAILRKAS